ncbi:MAG: UDP-3-O-(3-hydroxymyristoyl)glucosamine N-acyltransferase [Deltaproteobacteria bacterium]|nr:UDP-3-O-(3-hydroxymyristoyl)glucosamine N-acyltransferase [Deltaproteobacteria bacterium]
MGESILEVQKWSLKDLASQVGAKLVGKDHLITGAAPIESARVGEITFLAHRRFESWIHQTQASAIVIEKAPSLAGERSFLIASNPYLAFARILGLLYPVSHPKPLSGQAMVASTASVASEAILFPFSYVGERSRIGRGTVLYPGVYVGEDCTIGQQGVLYPNTSVLNRCKIGDRVIVHSGAVIGSDGFGYAVENGERVKIPHVGIVRIEDDVEIGAGATIDRATLGETVIGRGTKIDNQVQIAHNVVIGPHSVLVSQVGISGSSQIGKGVILAGQVGVAQGMKIGDGAIVGPKSGVGQNIEPGEQMMGYPAMPVSVWRRSAMSVKELPRLRKKVAELERRLQKLEKE